MNSASHVLLVLNLFVGLAHGATLSEPAIFARCYAQLTGRPVPLGHTVMKQVRDGTLQATEACSIILEKARLSAAGTLQDANDPEATAVLTQFYNFHRALFNIGTVEQLPEANTEYSSSTDDLYDVTQPALAMTKVVFGGHKYNEMLTTLGDVRAIRRPNSVIETERGWTARSPSRRIYGNLGSNGVSLDSLSFSFRSLDGAQAAGEGAFSIMIPPPTLVQTGDLIGIRPATETLMVPNFTLAPFTAGPTEVRGNISPGMTLPYNALKTAGAGILGYPIYMMSYWGHGKSTLMNGTTKVPRRWAISSLQNFLCASMPDLRAEDVPQYLDTASSAPFRQQAACLGCHATMDRMAYTLRNYTLAFADFSVVADVTGRLTGKTVHLLPDFTPSQPSVAGWPIDPVANFHLQAPSGHFYYRTLSGQLIDTPVNNLNELGSAMAATDDFYLCAAKHYFQFLTGIQVPLFDRGNPANASLLLNLSPQSVADRKYLESLAAQLKADPNQSALALVKTIIASPYYRDSNFRPK